MTIDIGKIVTEIAPDLISSGIDLIGSQVTSSQNSDAASDYSANTQAAAGRINEGYDQQLGHVEQGADYLDNLLGSQLYDTTNAADAGYEGYNTGTRDAYGKYAEFMYPQLDAYGNKLVQADNLYRTEVNAAENQAVDYLGQGADAYASYYNPYMDSGENALSYMNATLQQDPSELNPYQDRMLDQYRRDAIARLATSGLRGAGRAGVAAVNEGEAALLADMYRTNQGRSDSAAQTLNQQGYTASGNVAANEMGLGNTMADLRYKTANMTANNTQGVGQNMANNYYNLGQNVGDKIHSGESNIASNTLQQGKDNANLIGQYYGNVGNVEAGRYGARADTAMGKATNDATATGLSRDANFGADIANAQVQGNAIGKIASNIGTSVKKGIEKQKNPATQAAD